MSAQIVERELAGFILELQLQGRHCEAAMIESEIFDAHSLTELCKLRDEVDEMMSAIPTRSMTLRDRVPHIAVETVYGTEPAPAIDVSCHNPSTPESSLPSSDSTSPPT